MTVEVSPPSLELEIRPTQFLRILTTRSVMRAYTEAPIAPDVVNALLQGLQAAPSAGNDQAWSFIVVQNPRSIQHLRSFAPGVLGVPPLVILACSDDSRGTDNTEEKQVKDLCVAMAVQNLLLTAHAHGLGACPVHSFRAEPLRLLFDLPPFVRPVLLVPIGHPARERHPSQRRAHQEVISYETHGQRTPVTHP
ncbi:nitroreductase family protein [Streptomyces sp. NPDC057116]|uniref:nitroreductase family protein n=1 Tax=Streptomyces sp. NPDC057116 TaxID=3346023 RepID=UPI003643EA72